MAAYTTIDDPEAHFQANIHTSSNPGSGGTQAVTLSADTDMQPDLVWLKNRASTSTAHTVFDAVRGTGKMLKPDVEDAEASDSIYGYLSAFNSDGFTLLGGSTNANFVAQSTDTYVAWCWKANGSGSSNTDGGINTTATSANTTSGFSISTYTGTGSASTVGHGLGVAPNVVLVKRRDNTESWQMLHMGISGEAEKYIVLHSNAAIVDSATPWNDTDPTSTVFSVGTANSTNGSSSTYVAYCWADVQGFSKFGSYTGNGNADGPFVYTGFKPAFVILKRTASTNNWQLGDNKRTTSNPVNKFLFPDTDGAEESFTLYDSLSNGFKIRSSTSAINTSGEAFIYMAFAEAPFVNSNGVPCNAE